MKGDRHADPVDLRDPVFPNVALSRVRQASGVIIQQDGQPVPTPAQQAKRSLNARDGARQVESPWLTAHEALAYLKLGSLSALYHLIREQRLPHGRVGRAYRFDKRRLDRWVETTGLSELPLRRRA